MVNIDKMLAIMMLIKITHDWKGSDGSSDDRDKQC